MWTERQYSDHLNILSAIYSNKWNWNRLEIYWDVFFSSNSLLKRKWNCLLNQLKTILQLKILKLLKLVLTLVKFKWLKCVIYEIFQINGVKINKNKQNEYFEIIRMSPLK